MVQKLLKKPKGSFIRSPPLFNNEERWLMAGSCKWVDDSVIIPEYYMDVSVLEKFKVDCVMHGDDVVIGSDGKHCYDAFIQLGKYKYANKRIQTNARNINNRHN